MPLLEVTQTRYVSASIRLTDTTAILTDQYDAFIHACADDVVEQALTYVFSKDRDFQDFSKTQKRGSLHPHFASAKHQLPKHWSRLRNEARFAVARPAIRPSALSSRRRNIVSSSRHRLPMARRPASGFATLRSAASVAARMIPNS
jgi:hypothetical protein